MEQHSEDLIALNSLSQIHRSIHEERIKRELTLVVSLVTFYTACVGLKYSTAIKLPLDDLPFRIGVIAYFGVLAAAAGVYLRGSARANNYNQRMAERAEDKIIQHLAKHGVQVLPEIKQTATTSSHANACGKHPNRNRWRWQLAIIVFAAGCATLVVTCTPNGVSAVIQPDSLLATASQDRQLTLVHVIPTLIAGGFALLGVAIGFLLNAWRDNRKENRRIKQTTLQLREELRANLQMLPWKRDILEQIVSNLKVGKVLPGDSVRFVRVFYTEHFAAMCPYLSELERNSIHVIYERLRVVDDTMSSYESELRSVIPTAASSASGQGILSAFARIYLGKMEDLLSGLSVTEGLIKKHVAGTPEAVFHVEATQPEQSSVTK